MRARTHTHTHTAGVAQVVLGVLGCPNLSLGAPLDDEAGGPVTTEQMQSGELGAIFAAERGQGAFVGPLEGVWVCACVGRCCVKSTCLHGSAVRLPRPAACSRNAVLRFSLAVLSPARRPHTHYESNYHTLHYTNH